MHDVPPLLIILYGYNLHESEVQGNAVWEKMIQLVFHNDDKTHWAILNMHTLFILPVLPYQKSSEKWAK